MSLQKQYNMAFLTIIGTDNNIKVSSGVYYPDYVTSELTYYNPNMIEQIKLEGGVVIALISGSTDAWKLSCDGSEGTLKVDTINGVAPLDNTDLCNKLGELIRV